jgi:hypothetical protein
MMRIVIEDFMEDAKLQEKLAMNILSAWILNLLMLCKIPILTDN